jgi:hypothetical protein
MNRMKGIMKNAIIPALMLFALAGCDWTGGFMTDPPAAIPLGSCLENRLACNVPEEKPKPQPQPQPQQAQPPADLQYPPE